MRPFPKICKTKPKVTDVLIKLRDAPAVIKKLTGVTRTRKTVYNWMTKGCRAYSGGKIKLGHELRFGEYYTTRESLEKFFDSVEG